MAQARRKALSLAVCASCHENGFSSVEIQAVEYLTVSVQALISELGRSAQTFAEHNGRVETTLSDVTTALIDLGMDVNAIDEFAKRRNIVRIPSPAHEPPHRQTELLQAGQKRQMPSHIPDYFPPFPDPHTYIRTPTHKHPIDDYEAVREKAANQKRDIEKALTKFMAKVHPSPPGHSLFGRNHPELNKLFPLINVRPEPYPYLRALLPNHTSISRKLNKEGYD